MCYSDNLTGKNLFSLAPLFQRSLRPKKKDSCVQVSEVKKIRVGRSKNIFILEFVFNTNVQRL